MTWFSDLKLNTKINLLLSSLLICLFLLTALLTYRDQQQLVLNMALEQSRSVARQIITTTDYMSSVVRNEPENNYALVPQVVATQVAKRISEGDPYSVRQVSLTYRNPGNRPDSYEVEQLKAFADTSEVELYHVTKVNGDRVFRYMRSMIAENSCLECHGSYESAPLFIQQRYPRDHPSYNYKIGQVLGAVSVSKPLADLYREVGSNLRDELVYRVVILVLVFVAMGILIRRFMINPIQLASATIHRVTTTGNLGERIPAHASRDEVGQLIYGFNEMMAELERTTLQRQESESRYQRLIEASQSAIVTFLENGKIVISNHLAESLLGLSRHKLLGETIFDYFENGQDLKQRIDDYCRDGKWHEMSEISRQRLLQKDGQPIDVEVTLVLASNLDHVPMFTAIIKEAGTS
ncbi:MAG: c-type heme family protein [Desulfuromonadales bacterium]